MRVVVLGAGASHGASSHVGVPCPLVGGFFEAAMRHGLFDQELLDNGMAKLKREIEQAGGDPERFRALGMDLEKGRHLEILKEFVREQLGVTPDEYLNRPIDTDFIEIWACTHNQKLVF